VCCILCCILFDVRRDILVCYILFDVRRDLPCDILVRDLPRYLVCAHSAARHAIIDACAACVRAEEAETEAGGGAGIANVWVERRVRAEMYALGLLDTPDPAYQFDHPMRRTDGPICAEIRCVAATPGQEGARRPWKACGCAASAGCVCKVHGARKVHRPGRREQHTPPFLISLPAGD
jgi:hypothetical protein